MGLPSLNLLHADHGSHSQIMVCPDEEKYLGRRKEMGNMPVVKISWFDSMNFIKKLNALNEGVYRLTTEVEWGYAARAGSKDTPIAGKIILTTRGPFTSITD